MELFCTLVKCAPLDFPRLVKAGLPTSKCGCLCALVRWGAFTHLSGVQEGAFTDLSGVQAFGFATLLKGRFCTFVRCAGPWVVAHLSGGVFAHLSGVQVLDFSRVVGSEAWICFLALVKGWLTFLHTCQGRFAHLSGVQPFEVCNPLIFLHFSTQVCHFEVCVSLFE